MFNQNNSEEEIKDFYMPGESPILDDYSVIFEEIPQEQMFSPKLLPEWAYAQWAIPQKVNGEIGDGAEISPYRPWRRRAKQAIYEKLKMQPEQSPVYLTTETEKEVSEMPQPPTVFLDGVPNFDEIPPFLGNTSFGQVETERGIWGELISALEKAGTSILEAEKKKYEAQLKAYQATVAPTVKQPTEVSLNKLLPYLLIGGAVYLLLKKDKKVKR